MRRIVIIVILVAVTAIAGYMLLKPRAKQTERKVQKAAEDVADAVPVGKKGTKAKLKARTKEQLKAEKEQRKREEKRRRREQRRGEKERQRQLRLARSRRGRRARRGRKGVQLYTVSAIVSMGSESYALVGGRRVGVGNVVMGRRIMAIYPDRLEVEASGKLTVVRVGESLLPAYYSERRRRG